MSLPYENATSGAAALADLNKLLTKFGCTRFGTMTDVENGGYPDLSVFPAPETAHVILS